MPGQGPPRSRYAATESRRRLAWPEDRNFRVLSLDGGGIKGLFTAALLAELERRTGRPVHEQFDLIAGTSTGGILAIGLAAGIPAHELVALYRDRGPNIFRTWPWPLSWVQKALGMAVARYDARHLEEELVAVLGREATMTDALTRTRLCVQAFDAVHGEVAVLKTPHHPTYHLDGEIPLYAAGLATAAAPTYFRPDASITGYVMADGGVWANNPVMVGVVEALSAFDVAPGRTRVVSIGCGEPDYRFGFQQRHLGGLLPWAKVMFTAMRLQSQNANGQAKHLVGVENMLRIDVADRRAANIALDDCQRAAALLPNLGHEACVEHIETIRRILEH